MRYRFSGLVSTRAKKCEKEITSGIRMHENHRNIATCKWWCPFLYFGVEKATCFKWLQHVSFKEPCSSQSSASRRQTWCSVFFGGFSCFLGVLKGRNKENHLSGSILPPTNMEANKKPLSKRTSSLSTENLCTNPCWSVGGYPFLVVSKEKLKGKPLCLFGGGPKKQTQTCLWLS